jgi:hypothetical protein
MTSPLIPKPAEIPVLETARLTLRPILVGGRPSGTRRFAAPCIADPVTALRTMERVAARSAPFGTRFRAEGDAWIAD